MSRYSKNGSVYKPRFADAHTGYNATGLNNLDSARAFYGEQEVSKYTGPAPIQPYKGPVPPHVPEPYSPAAINKSGRVIHNYGGVNLTPKQYADLQRAERNVAAVNRGLDATARAAKRGVNLLRSATALGRALDFLDGLEPVIRPAQPERYDIEFDNHAWWLWRGPYEYSPYTAPIGYPPGTIYATGQLGTNGQTAWAGPGEWWMPAGPQGDNYASAAGQYVPGWIQGDFSVDAYGNFAGVWTPATPGDNRYAQTHVFQRYPGQTGPLPITYHPASSLVIDVAPNPNLLRLAQPFPNIEAIIHAVPASLTLVDVSPRLAEALSNPAATTKAEMFIGGGPPFRGGAIVSRPGWRQPPRKREKHRKGKGPIAVGAALADSLSEGAEVVDALYEALPKKTQKKWSCNRSAAFIDKAGQYGIDNADCKLKALYHNWHLVDADAAVRGIVANHLEDKFIGAIQKVIPRNSINAFEGGEKVVAKGLDALFKAVGLKE